MNVFYVIIATILLGLLLSAGAYLVVEAVEELDERFKYKKKD